MKAKNGIEYSFINDMFYWSKGWYSTPKTEIKMGDKFLNIEESLECLIKVHYQESGIPEPRDQYILYYISIIAQLFDFDLYKIILNEMNATHSEDGILNNNYFTIKSWRTHMACRLKDKLSEVSNDELDYEKYNILKCDRENNTHLNPDILEYVQEVYNTKIGFLNNEEIRKGRIYNELTDKLNELTSWNIRKYGRKAGHYMHEKPVFYNGRNHWAFRRPGRSMGCVFIDGDSKIEEIFIIEDSKHEYVDNAQEELNKFIGWKINNDKN